MKASRLPFFLGLSSLLALAPSAVKAACDPAFAYCTTDFNKLWENRVAVPMSGTAPTASIDRGAKPAPSVDFNKLWEDRGAPQMAHIAPAEAKPAPSINFDSLKKAQVADQTAPSAPKMPGFKCEADKTGKGGYCQGFLPDKAYPKRVTMIYATWPPPNNPEVILYLHGHNRPYDEILQKFDFNKLLASSGRTGAVIVVPDGTTEQTPEMKKNNVSPYLDQTYNTQFAGKGAASRFRKFVSAIETSVGGKVTEQRPLVLAGHSGGGKGLFNIINCEGDKKSNPDPICWKNSRELYMLDAAWNPNALPAFADFANEPGHRFLSISKADTSTKLNDEIRRLVNKRGSKNLKSLPSDTDPKLLRETRTAFMQGDKNMTHDGTVNKLSDFLAQPPAKPPTQP